MKKWIAVVAILAMILTLTACGGGEETTVTGMVMSVKGTTISLMEMGGDFGGRMPMGEKGEMPTRPEGMEDLTMPENVEDFTAPEGMEDFTRPENFDPEKMKEFGEGEGPQMPPNGEMPGRENFGDMGEATTLNLAEAHISIEIDGGKESGTMENIVPGTLITVTIDGKGNATYVLVSQSFGFGFGGPGGFDFPEGK